MRLGKLQQYLEQSLVNNIFELKGSRTSISNLITIEQNVWNNLIATINF
ncbi:hypothetical protein HAV_00129 [Candidatus Hepatincola sp. Av]